MQVIAAMRAGITAVAPSFNMEFGEARFLASEVSVADAVLAEQPGGFAFGDVSRSDAFAEFDVSALLTPSFKCRADRRCYVSTYNKVDTYDRDKHKVAQPPGCRSQARRRLRL